MQVRQYILLLLSITVHRIFRNSAAMQKEVELHMVTCLQMMEEVVSVLRYDIFVCMYFYELLIDVM